MAARVSLAVRRRAFAIAPLTQIGPRSGPESALCPYTGRGVWPHFVLFAVPSCTNRSRGFAPTAAMRCPGPFLRQRTGYGLRSRNLITPIAVAHGRTGWECCSTQPPEFGALAMHQGELEQLHIRREVGRERGRQANRVLPVVPPVHRARRRNTNARQLLFIIAVAQ